MATTTNYSWTTPDDTDLVKDGAAAIRTLGSSIDTTVFNNAGAAVAKSTIDAKGDLLVGTADDTVGRLAVGTDGYTLVADSVEATGLKWAAPSSGTPAFVGCVATRTSSSQSISAATYTVITLPSEELDTDGFHSTSTNTSRFTIPAGKAGKYMVNANLSLSQTPGSQSILAIAKNGTRVTGDGYDSGGFYTEKNGADQLQGASTIIVLAENDYVEIQIYAASSCNIAFTRMSLIYLGA